MFSIAQTIHSNLVSTVQEQQAVPARHSGPQKTVCHSTSSEAGLGLGSLEICTCS